MKEVMIELNDEEKEILQFEIGILSKKSNGSSKTAIEFNKLLASVNEKLIDEVQLPVFSHILELLLTTGDIRKNYGPVEEQKIFRLYSKTPAGREQKESIDELNRSLKALETQTIEGISFSLKLPGVYGISIKTDKCELSLNATKSGIYADKFEIEI
jgi:hypothetical protein